MSSILRALKKLESEPQHLERPQGVDSKYISLAGPEHRTSTVRPLLLFIGGGIACGMVVLTGWWFMHEKPQPGVPTTQESPNQAKTIDTPITEPLEPVSIKPEIPSPAAVQEQIESKPAPTLTPTEQTDQPVVPSAPVSSSIKPATPVPADTPATITPDESPLIETAPAPDEIPVKQIPLEPDAKEKTITTVTVLPETPAETKEPEIPLLNDPDVRLQSISWSKNPSKRLAVVSNRIIREGEMVSGYLLVTINKDDVILHRKGERWRINFRIK